MVYDYAGSWKGSRSFDELLKLEKKKEYLPAYLSSVLPLHVSVWAHTFIVFYLHAP